MEKVSEDVSKFAIDAEMLQEILHIFKRRGDVQTGLLAIDALMSLFSQIVPITATEIRQARDLMPQYPRLSARDAIHAAVVQLHDLEGIVSADRAFDGVEGLERFDPLNSAAWL
jgi:predicted nucleic acid-binding protein